MVVSDGLRLANAKGIPNGTLNLGSSAYVANNGQRFRIGRLSGSGTLAGLTADVTAAGSANTWVIGNDDNWSWSGVVAENSLLEKVGSGRVTLTGQHTFTGRCTVSEGQLHTANISLGTGALTVAEGAVFSGIPTLKNSSVNIDGTLQPGQSANNATSGNMKFSAKNVTLSTTSTLSIGIRACTTASNTGCTQLQDIAKLTANGTVTVHLAANYTPTAGDSIRIVSAQNISGSPRFDLPTLANGLYWDTTDFLTTGLLRISDVSTAISQTVNRESVNSKYYDLQGRRIDNTRKGSVYIRRTGNGSKLLIH